MSGNSRGRDREANLSREEYFSNDYFGLRQLFSMAHQLHEIHRLRPDDVLEVGPGNGFVSTLLRRAGYEVVTADINPALEPDVCASIEDLPTRLDGREFDLVVCCEVLEHMPFAEFEGNVRTLSRLGRRLFITVPDCRRAFGFGGILRLPKWGPALVNRYLQTSWAKGIAPAHFWEIGSSAETGPKNVQETLGRHYTGVRTGRFALNPYHVWFTGVRPGATVVERGSPH